MSPEMVFIDAYVCPRCRAELETRFHEWQGWQRCPTCGTPSLPPEPVQMAGIGRQGGESIADEVLVISDARGNLDGAEFLSPSHHEGPSYVSGARLVFRTGLVVSAGLAFIFFLDRRTTNMVIFAALAFVFFLLLLRKTGRRASQS